MIYNRPSAGRVKLDEPALHLMLSLRQLDVHAGEAGGVLLGRHILGTDDVVIDMATPPLAGDRCTRTTFRRSQTSHQSILDGAWKRSNGTSVYLGEWHTHPEKVPQPSRTDLADWHRRLRHDNVQALFALFFIVGQTEVRGWEGSRIGFDIRPMMMEGR